MKMSSKFADGIRVRSASKKQEKTSDPECQWDGCDKPGTHKAPVGRMKEGEYFHFCVNHVRQYNKSYNYFSGLADNDVAKFQKEALTGHRPTWTVGTNGKVGVSPDMAQSRSGHAGYYNKMRDPHEVLRQANARRGTQPRQKRLKPLEAKALESLGLGAKATGDEIKARYKELVKLHHPDANGGDRGSEDRFRDVVQSYRLLKQAGFC